MRATGSTNSSSNAVSVTVTVVLLAVSAGLYYLKVIGVPLLVILVIISLLTRKLNKDRRPVGKGSRSENGEIQRP